MKYYAGIDLGGTNIVAGIVDENFVIVASAKRKTALPRPCDAIVEDRQVFPCTISSMSAWDVRG